MKKSKVLEYLAGYKDDDELLIAWWDKETTGHELTDQEWADVVRIVDDVEYALAGVSEAIDEAVEKIKGEDK
jgi:hypothetical protein